MKEELTAEKLKEYGFSESHVNEIMEASSYESNCANEGEYYISKSEMLIYSCNERFIKSGKPLMFPHYNIELIPDYFSQRLEVYLLQESNILGKIYNKEKAIERFKQGEIRSSMDAINHKSKFDHLTSQLKNITHYNGYIDFLNEVIVGPHKPLVATNNNILTLQTNLNEDQIKTLFKLLIAGKYIKEINVVDFVYWLTGKPIINTLPKIKWLKSKGMALQLFKNICLNFSNPSLNNCIEANGLKFDSNNVAKTDYHEIDEILKEVKR